MGGYSFDEASEKPPSKGEISGKYKSKVRHADDSSSSSSDSGPESEETKVKPNMVGVFELVRKYH